MSDKTALKPVAMAVGTALATSVAAVAVAADQNPFTMTTLSAGYMLDGHGEGGCGEGKCGEAKGDDKGDEGSCGEGKGEEGSCGGEFLWRRQGRRRQVR